MQNQIATPSNSQPDNPPFDNLSSRQFLLNTLKIQYQNHYSVNFAPDTPKVSGIVVSNFVSKRQGESILKKTQIRIGQHLIVLEDSYHIESAKELSGVISSQSDSSTALPDAQLAKKSTQTAQEDHRDRKNVIKNIVKAFECWLRRKTAQDFLIEDNQLHNNRKTLERIIAKIKFNNRLINTILNNSTLRMMFDAFLKTEANEWLENSKIKDRAAHREGIDKFLMACSSMVAPVSKVTEVSEES